MRVILASTSPRRKEILSFFTLPFEQHPPYFDENAILFDGDPLSYAKTLSEGKAASLAGRFSEAVILAADTIVFHAGKAYSKPNNEEEAFSMLKTLSGNWHSVFTAVTAQKGEKKNTEIAETKVLFHPLSEEQIRAYHTTYHCIDKAGGYGIQEGGSIIVKKIEGCFYNVMGLPIGATAQVLSSHQIDLWRYLK